MKILKPPIRYFGGKSNMINKILEHFPQKDTYDTYVECFGGSYSVGLSINPYPPIEIYNDIDLNVFSLYKTLSNKDLFDEFKSKCDLVLYDEFTRNEFKSQLKYCNLSIVDRAFYFFYVNRTSFNGTGGFGMNMHVRRGMSKSISDFLSAVDRLTELHNRLSRIIVTQKDGIDLISKYNTPNIFLYLDPPYEQSTRTNARYNVDMDESQHIRLINNVIESKSKILISGYHCDLYNTLLNNGFTKIDFDVKTTGGDYRKKTKTESLYKNY